ncbi:hypothetical protein OG729_08925 [Streptomyces sp. NBC_00210]|uniref:hypothetical protein n=1 Tax=unclassified Streptomyces TaxID=2593676 RepID=UPI00325065AE
MSESSDTEGVESNSPHDEPAAASPAPAVEGTEETWLLHLPGPDGAALSVDPARKR